MQMLAAQGMVADDLRSRLDTSNLLGDYEDVKIAEVYEEIFDALDISPLMPRDISRSEFKKIASQVAKLKKIVSGKAFVSNQTWGFKNPRTSNLLPVWEIIFRELDLQPKYILCVRNPGAVISSMKEHFSRGEAVSELLWLTRVCESITNCGKDLFIVHYEDWFADKDKAKVLATGMLNFASLSVKGVDSTLERLVKPNLNRSTSTYIPANPDVVRMYQALKELPSGESVTDSVMQMARECKVTTDFYVAVTAQASAKAVQIFNAEIEDGKRQLEERIMALEIEVKEHSEAKAELETRINRQGKQRKLIEENQLALEGKITSLEREIVAINEAKASLNDLKTALELQVSNQTKRRESAEEEQRALEGKIVLLESELAALNDSKMALELQVSNQTKRRESAEVERQTLKADLDSLKNEIDGLIANRAALQLTLAEHSSRIEEDTKSRSALEQRIAELTKDLTNLTEAHRKTALHFKAACDENDKLRIQLKSSNEILKPVQRPKAAVKKVEPAKAIQRKAEPPPLSPAQRKMRKLARSPGLFFKDWYSASRKKLGV
jgi:hypothetical protein